MVIVIWKCLILTHNAHILPTAHCPHSTHISPLTEIFHSDYLSLHSHRSVSKYSHILLVLIKLKFGNWITEHEITGSPHNLTHTHTERKNNENIIRSIKLLYYQITGNWIIISIIICNSLFAKHNFVWHVLFRSVLIFAFNFSIFKCSAWMPMPMHSLIVSKQIIFHFTQCDDSIFHRAIQVCSFERYKLKSFTFGSRLQCRWIIAISDLDIA